MRRPLRVLARVERGSEQADAGGPARTVARAERSSWAIAILLLVITALGFAFRLAYALDVPFFVDEYLQVRAAERIVAQGVPLLPSGNFYSHGLFLSYLVAGLIGLGARADWLLRLPVLLLSTACIPLTYWLGRRAFSAATGLLAAGALAVAGDAILWGGRVRMYAPLQFFALALTAVFYLWVVEERDRSLYRALFVLAFWGALFSHAEAMLLLPILAAWALVQRGWQWSLRPANWGAFALAGLSVLAEILLRGLGPPVQARLGPGIFQPQARQYLGTGIDWPGVAKVVEPLFLAPERLAPTLLVIAGMGWLLVRLALSRREGVLDVHDRGLLYLYTLLVPVLLLLLFAVDPEWKSPRYGLMLLPHYFLIAAAVLVLVARGLPAFVARWASQKAGRQEAGQQQDERAGPARLVPAREGRPAAWLAPAAAVVLIVATSWPSALAATRERVPDYGWAFEYVAGQVQPGDQVATFLCPAAFWHLGRCDFLAVPADYEGFAMQRDGQWVSGWDLVPIVDSAAGLGELLDAAPRVWFVIDEGRLAGRYDAQFVETLLQRTVLVAHERRMAIFLGSR
jgi:hypothetical protein